jgi:hypothetical protein
MGSCHTVCRVNARNVTYVRRVNCPLGPARGIPQVTQTALGRLPWGFVPYDAYRNEQRPTPGLPGLAVLRLQAFSTS